MHQSSDSCKMVEFFNDMLRLSTSGAELDVSQLFRLMFQILEKWFKMCPVSSDRVPLNSWCSILGDITIITIIISFTTIIRVSQYVMVSGGEQGLQQMMISSRWQYLSQHSYQDLCWPSPFRPLKYIALQASLMKKYKTNRKRSLDLFI